ncbi:MAG TPA: DUF1343 domain-containing protein, partial [Catalimonadaceae bacterium]|nr:DUF1343 domain-containing protein [Catalimonadaceae bacterium]
TLLGAPNLKDQFSFTFKPIPLKGMAENPLYKDKICFGLDLRNLAPEEIPVDRIQLKWLMEMYQKFPEKNLFFDRSISNQIGDFDKLAGTRILRKQIESGLSETKIRNSWEPGLVQFRALRSKYLLYP